ncbi:MAG: tetratricopeptide repeat protein [bacterium]
MRSGSSYSPYVILCVVGVLLYFKSFFFGFSYLDDNQLILNNLSYLEDIGNVFNAFAHDVFFMMHSTTAYYRPFLTISFMPEAMIGGAMPFFYHFMNVAIHLVAACLMYLLFIKLNYSKRISLFVALIFVVHPVLTQAVAWIPGRNDSLLAVFVLASFIYFLDFLNRGEKQKLAIWSTLFFVLALFTKETAIVLPALCIGYLWLRNRFKMQTLLPLSIGWLFAIVIWIPIRLIAMSNPMSLSLHDTASSFIENIPGTIPLIGKVFFPFNLSVLPILQDTTFIFGYFTLALMVLVGIFQMRHTRTPRHTCLMMFFGLFWFALFLLPPFIISDPSGTTYFLEHRLYLPIIGLLIFIAESRVGHYLERLHRKPFLSLALLLMFIFSAVTFVHQDVFAHRLVFWQDAASHSPHSSLAQKNLGAMYYLDQNYDLAEIYSKKALTLNLEEPMAHNNLGLIYANRGQVEEAKNEYLKELSFNPYYDDAHYNFGLLYYKIGDFENARKQWEETLRINPNSFGAWQALQALNAEGK